LHTAVQAHPRVVEDDAQVLPNARKRVRAPIEPRRQFGIRREEELPEIANRLHQLLDDAPNVVVGTREQAVDAATDVERRCVTRNHGEVHDPVVDVGKVEVEVRVRCRCARQERG
jgi:hypothetical protein